MEHIDKYFFVDIEHLSEKKKHVIQKNYINSNLYNSLINEDYEEIENVPNENLISELSELEISDQGIFKENWNVIESFPSIIEEFDSTTVTLKVMENMEEGQISFRKFEILLFKNKISIKIGKLILIKIFKKPGEIKFKFIDGDGLIDPKLFYKNNYNKYFEGLDNTKLTKKYNF